MANHVYPCPPPQDCPNNHQIIGSTRRNYVGRLYCLYRWICMIILILGGLGCSASVIGWSIYSMSLKDPYIPEFQVESAIISQLSTNGSSLTATWDIGLLVRNPNPSNDPRRKYKIYFDSVLAEVQYHYIGDTIIRLGSTWLPPFDLKETKDRRIHFRVGAVRKWISDAVAQQISNDMYRGSVRFDVRLSIAVRFKATLRYPQYYEFTVCNEHNFGFSGKNATGVSTTHSRCHVG